MGKAREGAGKVVEGIGKLAQNTSAQVVARAGAVTVASADTVKRLSAKSPNPYEDALAEYNGAFAAMNDTGLSLLRQRERSTDLIGLVEQLVNSITNTPKIFSTHFAVVDAHKVEFLAAQDFARQDLEAARQSAAATGAGFAAGAAVASMAPTAAMWVATTFGTASTGTAISTLSGAAATKAALAWLGGGALAAGGGGTAAGSALLALAGPIGWTVAGATLLGSIAVFTKKKFETRDAKRTALIAVKQNTQLVRHSTALVAELLQLTSFLRERLLTSYGEALVFFRADFQGLSLAQQSQLAILVNNTKACAALLSQRIDHGSLDE